MDSWSRNISSQATIVNSRQNDLRREAAEARLLKAAAMDDASQPTGRITSFRRRLVELVAAHGHATRTAARDTLAATSAQTRLGTAGQHTR